MGATPSARSDVYCIDTSALIDLERWYPPKNFPGVWHDLEGLIRGGRLIAPKEVLAEINRGSDELTVWAGRNRKLFVSLSKYQEVQLRRVLAEFPDLVDRDKETPDADPFVVALALAERQALKKNMFAGDCLVVTSERMSKGGRPRIPNACAHYHLEYVTLTQLVQREGWSYARE